MNQLKDRNSRLPTDVLPLIHGWLDQLPDTQKNRYLRDTIFSKYVSKETDPADVRADRAISKWLSTEEVNAETNDRLLSTPDATVLLSSVRFGRFCEWTAEFIRRIIGDFPTDPFSGSFSGGASTSRRRSEGHPALKFVGQDLHTTSDCRSMFDPEEYPLWYSTCAPTLVDVPGSDIFTVPKNTEIDRVACKEPDINMFLQKGLGAEIRAKLRRAGIDLNDQSRNRDLARIGSASGELATLDLSSASDSVSHSIVELLLPPLWYTYLNAFRSKKVRVRGEWHTCEMFSSMGNGFTFELESLLFYALARATAYFTGTKGVVSVYGDDIIIPVEMTHEFTHVLFYFGFTPNHTKSFSTGSFRESCGGHYWLGNDITPFFIRKPIERVTDLIHLLNSIRIWASREQSLFLDEDAWVIWDLLSDLVPKIYKGGDVTSAGKYQLISPDYPRKRLSPIKREKSLPQDGKYLHSMSRGIHIPKVGKWTLARTKDGLMVKVFDPDDSVVSSIHRDVNFTPWTWHDHGLDFLAEVTGLTNMD